MTVNSLEIDEPEDVDQAEINKLFTTFECLGPGPRTCFKDINVGDDELYIESIEDYLRKVD